MPKAMPTTLGLALFKDYYPDRDAFVVEKLKKAGAIILAKATLGELGGGDTHGSLFGSTRNPYDPDRTAGEGPLGVPAWSVVANFCAVGSRTRRFCVDPPSFDLELRSSEVRLTAGLVSRARSLWGLAVSLPDLSGPCPGPLPIWQSS